MHPDDSSAEHKALTVEAVEILVRAQRAHLAASAHLPRLPMPDQERDPWQAASSLLTAYCKQVGTTLSDLAALNVSLKTLDNWSKPKAPHNVPHKETRRQLEVGVYRALLQYLLKLDHMTEVPLEERARQRDLALEATAHLLDALDARYEEMRAFRSRTPQSAPRVEHIVTAPVPAPPTTAATAAETTEPAMSVAARADKAQEAHKVHEDAGGLLAAEPPASEPDLEALANEAICASTGDTGEQETPRSEEGTLAGGDEDSLIPARRRRRVGALLPSGLVLVCLFLLGSAQITQASLQVAAATPPHRSPLFLSVGWLDPLAISLPGLQQASILLVGALLLCLALLVVARRHHESLVRLGLVALVLATSLVLAAGDAWETLWWPPLTGLATVVLYVASFILLGQVFWVHWQHVRGIRQGQVSQPPAPPPPATAQTWALLLLVAQVWVGSVLVPSVPYYPNWVPPLVLSVAVGSSLQLLGIYLETRQLVQVGRVISAAVCGGAVGVFVVVLRSSFISSLQLTWTLDAVGMFLINEVVLGVPTKADIPEDQRQGTTPSLHRQERGEEGTLSSTTGAA